MEVDASTSGVEAVLSQRQGESAQDYNIGNREPLPIKLPFDEWRHWLEGAKHLFLLITNHCNLENLQNARCFNPRQQQPKEMNLLRWEVLRDALTFHSSCKSHGLSSDCLVFKRSPRFIGHSPSNAK